MEYKIEQVKDFNIDDFEFWSGAKDRIIEATPEQKKQVAQRIEEIYCDEIPTETEINDFVWFECDDIFFGNEK